MADNLIDWSASAQHPPFALCSSIVLRPAMERVLAQTKRQVDALEHWIEQHPDQLNYETVVHQLERCSDDFERLWGLLGHLRSVADQPGIRQCYLDLQPQVIELSMRIAQSPKLYDGFCQVRDTGTLDEAQQRAITKLIHGAEQSGIGLTGDAREQFNQRQQRLAELSSQFSINVLDDSKAWSLRIDDPERITGLSPSWRHMTAQAAQAAGHETADAEQGPWLVSLDIPCYMPLMKDARDATLRREVHRAFIQRASSGKYDNSPVIQEILQLRKEQAVALGYEHYAAYSLSNKMASDVDTVFSLLQDIEQAAAPVQQQEYEDLQSIAGEFGISDIDPADWAFLTERLREQRFGISDEQLKPYFSYHHVWEVLCDICTEVFDITIEADDSLTTWHRDVQGYRICEQGEQGKAIAYVYNDPYARPGIKRDGAWMNSAVGRSRNLAADGQVRLPIAYLVCNFTPPMINNPAYLPSVKWKRYFMN